MIVLDSLLAISAYPIPVRTVEAKAARRGLDTSETAVKSTFKQANYRLTTADLMMWLYFAPDVSQGGQSYTLTDKQREEYKRQARQIYDELGGEDDKKNGVRYGYKGESL